MKILFTTFNKFGFGTNIRAVLLASEFCQLGHDVTVMFASYDKKFQYQGVGTLRHLGFPWKFHFLNGYNLSEAFARKRWVGKHKFDIVHAFEMRPTCAIPAFKAERNGAIIVNDWADWFGRGGSVEERNNPLSRMILRPLETYNERQLRLKTKATTTICSQLFNMATEMGFGGKQLLQLYNGFNREALIPLSKTEAREMLNLDQNARIAGCLGAFFAKDFDLLKQAAKICNEKEPIQFFHIGRSNLAVADEDLKTTGPLEDKRKGYYLQACDILLLPMADIPANHGRFPLKFSEYISTGHPVLTTRVGDVPKFVEAFACGYVSEPNPQDFAKTLLEAFDNPQDIEKRGQNALHLSQSPEHSWKNRALDLQTFYENLLMDS